MNETADGSGSSSGGNSALNRLIEKQEEELNAIQVKIDAWKNYQADYKELDKVINELSNKVKHKHNIPIAGTKVAFVPGHIVHTNELHVLLGDNLFALRSTKQASEIIKRRLKNLDTMLEATSEAQKKTQEWLKVASEYKQDKEEFVEIIEHM